MNKTKLAVNGLIKAFSGMILMGILLFLPFGTINYPGACYTEYMKKVKYRMITLIW